MRSDTEILHISPTPLVGAPGRISKGLNKFSDYSSECLVLRDYPGGLTGVFMADSQILSSVSIKEVKQVIQQSKIVHVHNFLPKSFIDLIDLSSFEGKLVYQAHSPLREGPLFYNRAETDFINLSMEKLVVSQYHPRHYPDYKLVPNIVLEEPSFRLLDENDVPSVIFSPSHERGEGRWNPKVSPNLVEVLGELENKGLLNLIKNKKVIPYEELFAQRRKTHITIDEIITGAYHQVSLEGLAAGNVVINNSDFFSGLALQSVVQAEEPPPFYRSNEENIKTRLESLLNDRSEIKRLQEKSYNYFCEYLNAQKLVKVYASIYERILNA